MIQIQITTNTSQQARQLASKLISEKLVLDAKIIKCDKIGAKGRVFKRSIQQHMIIGSTKALLFPIINKFVVKHSPKSAPEVYSLPIVHMDDQQAMLLRKTLTKV